MLTQSILNNNNPLLAIYGSNSGTSSGGGVLASTTTSTNSGTISNNNNNQISSNSTQLSKDIKDTSTTTAAVQMRHANDGIKQDHEHDLLQHIHERIREQALQEMQRRFHEQQIEDLINAGLINNNLLQSAQYNQHLKNIKNSTSPPAIILNKIKSPPVIENSNNSYSRNTSSKSPDSNSSGDSTTMFPRYNSIDSLGKKLNSMAKINSVEHPLPHDSPPSSSTSTTTTVTPTTTMSTSSLAKLALKDRLTSNLINNSKENHAKQLLHNRLMDGNSGGGGGAGGAGGGNINQHSIIHSSNYPLNTSLTNIIKNESNNSPHQQQQVQQSITQHTSQLHQQQQQQQQQQKQQYSNSSQQQSSILSSNTNVYVPPSTSNSVSNDVKQRLRENILRKQDKNFNGNTSLVDDSGLRRTSSEPTLKVKSALQNRLKQRITANPIYNTKRPYPPQSQQQSHQHYSPNSVNNNKTDLSSTLPMSLKLAKDTNEQNAVAAMVAAAIMQQQQQQQANQQYSSFNAQYNRLGLSAPFLNAVVSQSQPYLNPIHWQAFAAASALENYNVLAQQQQQQQQQQASHHNPSSLSLSALPNPNLLHRVANTAHAATPTNTTSFIPKFGKIAHVEEESEILLANELRNANKMDNSFIDNDDMNAYANSNANLLTNNLLKKLGCYSEPYLLKPHENDSNTGMSSGSGSKSSRMSKASIVDASTSDATMDYERTTYKYTTGIVYDESMLKHECTCHNPKNHIEIPDRLKAIYARLEARSLLDECELIKITKLASLDDIALCHHEFYTTIYGATVEERAKLRPEYLQYYVSNICLAECNGFALVSDQDNSWNEENTPIACRAAIAGTYELAELVTMGKLRNGFALVRPPGSHAEYNKPLGFCYFNNVAIVAKMLKKNLKLDRILIVDWDVHHGNGTQQLTYDDPNILFVSLHRHDNGKFFPGSGSIDECGNDDGVGFNVNIAWDGKLEPPMGDAEYLAAFRCIVMPIAKAFQPQLVLVSCGFDGTEGHPKELGGYKLTPMCFAYMTKKLMSLADGKVVLVLEGGYDLQSLCDSSEACLNALMNKQIPSFPSETLDAIPNNPAIETLENVIQIQRNYWPVLKDKAKYIKMSQNQFIRIDTAE